MIHVLKTDPAMWTRVMAGEKTFELRKDDRGYQSGDVLHLYEFRPEDHDCTDETCTYNWRAPRRLCMAFRVGFVAKGTFYGLPLGEYAVLSLLDLVPVGDTHTSTDGGQR